MNVWAVTYSHNEIAKTLLVESEFSSPASVRDTLHPAIYSKVTDIEYVGTLA